MGRFNRSSCLSKVCVFLQILETIARKKFIENLSNVNFNYASATNQINSYRKVF